MLLLLLLCNFVLWQLQVISCVLGNLLLSAAQICHGFHTRIHRL